MAADDLPGTDEERAEAALIAAAANILGSGNRDVPEDFVVALFAHAVPEDLMRYDPRQLAELAADAWALLAVRKPGVPNIRFDAPALAGHDRLRVDSVLEIVNDDMPFLVDSVLAELTERGIDIHLVVHPVLSVLRDGAGRLTAFKGTKSVPGALRESIIYVHVERIDEQARRAAIVEAIERVLADVRVCVADWRAMVGRVADVVVGLKRFDRSGKLTGEFRIVGLFTSTAYTRSTRSIPYLRRKVDAVVKRAGFDPDGHSGKALVNVLENYPRDELFQLDEDTLYEFALAVLQLDERPRVRVLPRRDRFDRFVSVLVYVPRERYGSGVRRAIGDYLADAYKGRVSAFYPFFPEGPLVRVHFIIGLPPGEAPNPDRASLERAIEAIVRTWVDELGDELARVYDAARARVLFRRYRDAF